MKKLMMIGLMAIAPLIATPSHSITPETIKLALAGTGFVGSMAHALGNEPGPHSLPIIGLLGGAGWVLVNLAEQSKSLLIRGTSKAIIGYSGMAIFAQELARDPNFAGTFGIELDKTGAFLYRALTHFAAIGYGVLAADGTKDIINGIAEKFESSPKQEEVPQYNHTLDQKSPENPKDKFFDAIAKGDLAGVQHYIAKGIDINQPMIHMGYGADWSDLDYNIFPLITAVSGSNYAIVKALLDSGADVNIHDDEGRTALHVATYNTDILTLLLQHGAKVDARDQDDNTPLHSAAEYGHSQSAKLLLEHGAEVDPYNNYGETPLHKAAYIAHVESAKLLLEYGANINAQTKMHLTPLHNVVFCYPQPQDNHKALIKLLLEKGADTTLLGNGDYAYTPYGLAIKFAHDYEEKDGYKEIAQILAEHEKSR